MIKYKATSCMDFITCLLINWYPIELEHLAQVSVHPRNNVPPNSVMLGVTWLKKADDGSTTRHCCMSLFPNTKCRCPHPTCLSIYLGGPFLPSLPSNVAVPTSLFSLPFCTCLRRTGGEADSRPLVILLPQFNFAIIGHAAATAATWAIMTQRFGSKISWRRRP